MTAKKLPIVIQLLLIPVGMLAAGTFWYGFGELLDTLNHHPVIFFTFALFGWFMYLAGKGSRSV